MLGVFLIVMICLAVDRLPHETSGPVERAIGHGARLVIAAVGLVGWLCDRLSGFEPEPVARST
jgi:hypothetical protein